jgi:hypothetical protein
LVLFVWWTNMCNFESKEWIVNCELWLWLYLCEIWWLACVAKCIGQQCPAIRIEGTISEFVVMDTLMELSRWQKMNTCELWNF